MSFLSGFLEFFKPNDFENDNYGWLTNQISHTSASFVLVYVFSFIFNYNYVSLFFVLFWLVWEIRHYIKSKNLTDFLEDLFFELSGVFIFLKTGVFLPLMILVTLILLIKRLKNE